MHSLGTQRAKLQTTFEPKPRQVVVAPFQPLEIAFICATTYPNMALCKLLGTLALGAVLLLDQATNVEACTCLPASGGVCGYVDTADVVLHATVLSR